MASGRSEGRGLATRGESKDVAGWRAAKGKMWLVVSGEAQVAMAE
ncbi:hypothetical protein [Paenibacillus phocaensis]|nr:hypothetical protein [Paenibacillus phocaensis]